MHSSLYIHYPFCESKCPYCDFNSHVRDKVNQVEFERAYLKEIDYYASILPKTKITSIFFGGGTPSLMPISMVSKILNKVGQKFSLAENIEVTLEANPSSSEAEKFKSFKKAGINRVSIGVQSFDEEELKFLGRRHNANEAKKTISFASEIFDNFSFDLIYALPNQTLEKWRKTLDFALAFGSPHLSLYQLTIEKGTEFYAKHKRGDFFLPPTPLQDKLFSETVKMAKNKGLQQYEISNFALRGFESKHNLNYWKYGNYIGVGAGAHGRLMVSGGWGVENGGFESHNNKKYSTINISNPENWLKSVLDKGNGIQALNEISAKEQLQEFFYAGLRIRDGIRLEMIGEIYKKSGFQSLLQKLVHEKLLVLTKTKLKPTAKGLKLHNAIIKKISDYI